MPSVAIAAYRPRPGQSGALITLLEDHVPTLRAAGFLTDTPAIAMRAADGTVIEVFEWKSDSAKSAAHAHPAVRDVWARFEGIADPVPLTALAEAAAPFANFQSLSL